MGALEDAMMTHWPEQPNPAKPYLEAAQRFAKGGISEVIGHRDPLGDVLQSDAANTAIGMAVPFPEKIVGAAFFHNGNVYSGTNHVMALDAARNAGIPGEDVIKSGKEGFLTSGNRFVDRKEAASIADAADQWRGPFKPSQEALETAKQSGITYEALKPLPGKIETSPNAITAFHGSPHDFDKFDLSRIGTGEGAQAYGRGLYFAENEGVAKEYRDTLGRVRGKIPDDIISLPPDMRKAVQTHADTDVDAITAAKRAQYMSSALRDKPLPEVTDMIERVRDAKRGKMYQVAIKADPEHFLDWDKPLSEQHPKVQEAVSPLLDKYHADVAKTYGGPPDPAWGDLAGNMTPPPRAEFNKFTGQRLVEALGNRAVNSPEVASALRQAGIPGIKYLDQGSRGTFDLLDLQRSRLYWEKNLDSPDAAKRIQEIDQAIEEEKNKTRTRNYVVFDDKMIDILKKYGLAGLGLTGAAAGSDPLGTGPMSPDPTLSLSQ
jgi:hypothetical protein